jgi:hypothetical protein
MARTNVTSIRRHQAGGGPMAEPAPARIKTVARRYRFRPRSFWPFISWGLMLLIGFRVLLYPLVEGLYHYVNKTQEIGELKIRYDNIQRQIAKLKQDREMMQTTGYVEARGHQIGLIKPNEEPMMVIDAGADRPGIIKMTRKNVEIGD